MRHWRVRRTRKRLELETVRRRLELLLAGMYGRPIRIGAEQGSAGSAPTRAAQDVQVVLPRSLDARDGVDAAAARYRLLAIEQAERVARGTPAEALPADPMERDLYAVAEGASVDRAIAARARGLAPTLARLRATELSQRPAIGRMTAEERAVELLLRVALAASDASDALQSATPAESLAWARAEAGRIRGDPRASGRYRGVPGVTLWANDGVALGMRYDDLPPAPSMADISVTSAAVPSAEGDESGSIRDPTGEQHDDPHGMATPSAGDGARGSEAPPPAPSGGPADTARSEGGDASSRPPAGGATYDEWDHYADRYRPDAVTVFAVPATESDDRWATDTLIEHAVIVRRVRERFSQLRAHRERLRAQRAGDDLDLDACVTALVDLRMRRVPSDRLYQLSQPARRTLAIVILVDVSGSTRETLTDERTVLDVERMAVLLASEALDALGDPYSVLAFSGCGRHDVRIRTIRKFGADDTLSVRRRISALAPMDNTRLGAALRHATAALNAQPAERRLLLLLSDGKPNDVGGYQGVYAVEDARRALAEARVSGVHPFCLTVDREETEYLPHLFGPTGYRLMRTPEQLPEALLRVVQQLIPR